MANGATGLDRALGAAQLYPYVVSNWQYYEQVGRDRGMPSTFFAHVETRLPNAWSLRRLDAWTHATPPAPNTPAQGFKLHLSSNIETALETLSIVTEVCLEAGAPFKFLSDVDMLELSVSKSFSRSGSGKFVTVYPDDLDHFKELAEALYRRTLHLDAPYILSDRNYKNSKVLFYRYGGLHPRRRTNVYGEQQGLLITPDGDEEFDQRVPYFTLPSWVENPFNALTVRPDARIVLNKRYEIKSTYKQSNAGGVHEAVDLVTGHDVVIKGARPLVDQVRGSALDACRRLQREYELLRALHDVPQVIKALDLFRSGSHQYLVLEKSERLRLIALRSQLENAPILHKQIGAKFIHHFCHLFDRVSRNLIQAVQRVHERGIAIVDLSASNVLLDPDSFEVTLIDFGSAAEMGRSYLRRELQVAPGCFPPDRLPACPDASIVACAEDDYYAMGITLFSMVYPVEHYLDLNPAARWPILDRVTAQLGLPDHIGRTIRALMEDRNPAQALAILDEAPPAQWAQPSPRAGAPATPLSEPVAPAPRPTEHVSTVLHGILDHLDDSACPKRVGRLWPADPRLFLTNPLSVAYGAVSPALLLHRVRGELSPEVEAWLFQRHQEATTDTYAPGLYVGLSGVAWAYHALGYVDRGLDLLNTAWQSPNLGQSPDLFYGDSGVGLAHLYFWHQEQDARCLDRAVQIGDALLGRAASTPTGIRWSDAEGQSYIGYAHGGSGAAHFLLELYAATDEPRFLDAARKALDAELAFGRPDPTDDSLSWPMEENGETIYPYWRYGSAGIGNVALRFYDHLGEEPYLTYARKAARECMRTFTALPNLFDGMAGLGEFLIDMYRATREETYLDAAWGLQGITLFGTQLDGGIAFPGQALLRHSVDLATGSAGVGFFLYRLLHPDASRPFHDLDGPGTARIPAVPSTRSAQVPALLA
ncbi:MAG: class III lanthionine synthetase LanKC [Bacteroidota bacterium]